MYRPRPGTPVVVVALLLAGGVDTARSQGCDTDPIYCSELVKPAERDQARWSAARCNDGTPFGFNVRLSAPGTQSWVIYLQGGGFCDDNAIPCEGRAASSTPPGNDGDLVDLPSNGGILNRDPAENVDLHDANQVYAQYCSSDGWTGATTSRRPTTGDPVNGWYFSGRTNVRALFETLIAEYGLNDLDPATRVLFTGSSSGGLGAFTNADVVADLLPRAASAGRLKVMIDGAWGSDFDHPDYRFGAATTSVHDVFLRAFDFFGSAVNPLCESAQREASPSRHPGDCLLGEVLYPFVTEPPPGGLGLPLFVQMSSLDLFGLEKHGIDPTNPAFSDAIEQWQTGVISSLAHVDWLFSGGRPAYHTISTSDERWRIGPTGRTFREMLSRFWLGGASERVIFDLEEISPGEGCIANSATLCLAENRFRFRAIWQDADGNKGSGKVLPGEFESDNAGLFSFSDNGKWDLAVRVLERCPSYDRFGVFAAAATNLEYSYRVTDTRTGNVMIYTNPLGVLPPFMTDADAFATCGQ